jgi:streptogramin lyase
MLRAQSGTWLIALAAGLAAGCTNPSTDRPDGDRPDAADDAQGEVRPDADAPDVPCTDEDGDGYGIGCSLGPDCDDTDAAHHDDCADCATTNAAGCACSGDGAAPCYEGPAGTDGVGACLPGERFCIDGVRAQECVGQILPVDVDRLCNDIDDDCDGVGDEALYGPCGSCDTSCETTGNVEPGAGDEGAVGLEPNPDGPGVVIGGGDIISAPYLWAANYDGTVSKLDLETGAEVSRYKVGLWGSDCDSPSRTAVDGAGNAYVASRALSCGAPHNQGSLTKMAGDRRFCIDRDRDGEVDTSTGSVALSLGYDECVLWTVPVGGPDGIPRGVAVDLGDEAHPWGFPWVGAFNEMRVYRINPSDGSVVSTVEVSATPYGLAADSLGGIWISGFSSGSIQYFHTETGTVETAIPVSGCSGSPYGITVDGANRVWVASYGSGSLCASRWDPATRTWFNVRGGGSYVDGRGIAAAADGTIWLATNGTDEGMVSWNAEDGSDLTVHRIGGSTPVGIGLDDLGHVWTVNQGTNNVSRLTLETGLMEQFPVGEMPYTYSDFTGYQRRIIAPDGSWARTFERCAAGAEDYWRTLVWDADAPPGQITINAQSADTELGLDGAPLVGLASLPDDVSPVDLAAAFAAAGEAPPGRFLRLIVTLRADARGRSPVFRSLNLTWTCGVVG